MVDDGNLQSASYGLLNADEPAAILHALVELKICDSSETIANVSKAGEGNMNLVLRVTTDQRSVIVKQARPWVEKYPSIAAPDERILSEIQFYRSISNADQVRAATPSVLAFDEEQRLLVLEDLGAASDYSMLYGSGIEQSEVDAAFGLAIDWVTQLHACDVKEDQNIGCVPLRTLNHQHIFSIPLLDTPAIDLDQVCTGLTNSSRALCSDESVRQAMEQLGEIYIKGGGKLLHGDFYPGSWLATDAGFRVIDPEFCFFGPPEFDLGVLAAHWIFCGSAVDHSTIDRVCQAQGDNISNQLVAGFAGAELIRRLVGVAQLPLEAELKRRTNWLECGVSFLQKL